MIKNEKLAKLFCVCVFPAVVTLCLGLALGYHDGWQDRGRPDSLTGTLSARPFKDAAEEKMYKHTGQRYGDPIPQFALTPAQVASSVAVTSGDITTSHPKTTGTYNLNVNADKAFLNIPIPNDGSRADMVSYDEAGHITYRAPIPENTRSIIITIDGASAIGSVHVSPEQSK